jgi:hypothetical protein
VTLTKRSTGKFQLLYLQHFGERLTEEEARRKAEYLLEVYCVVYGVPSAGKFLDNKIDEGVE